MNKAIQKKERNRGDKKSNDSNSYNNENKIFFEDGNQIVGKKMIMIEKKIIIN